MRKPEHRQARVQQIVLGAMAPAVPHQQHLSCRRRRCRNIDAVTARSIIPSDTTAAAIEQPTGSQSPPALAEPPQTKSESRQGTDGAGRGAARPLGDRAARASRVAPRCNDDGHRSTHECHLSGGTDRCLNTWKIFASALSFGLLVKHPRTSPRCQTLLPFPCLSTPTDDKAAEQSDS